MDLLLGFSPAKQRVIRTMTYVTMIRVTMIHLTTIYLTTKVLRISRQPSPVKIMIDQN
jgi:hypothetical protein